MSGPDLSHAVWCASSHSTNAGQCVEVAGVEGAVAVRDSRDRAGPVLIVGDEGWAALLAGIRGSGFDRR